jgi:hypothetical protein
MDSWNVIKMYEIANWNVCTKWTEHATLSLHYITEVGVTVSAGDMKIFVAAYTAVSWPHSCFMVSVEMNLRHI